MELEGADTMEIEEGAAGSAHSSGNGGGGGGGGGGGNSAGEADRLSALPDSLLHAIMSFLKARQAVQTCVLGKLWKHLCRTVPCLDVDHDEFRAVPKTPSSNNNNPAHAIGFEFVDDDLEGEDEDIKDDEWEKFEDFADSLMQNRNFAMLDSLRLHLSRDRSPRFASRQAGGWLRRTMKYHTLYPPPRQLKGWRSTNTWRLRRLYLCNVALDGCFRDHVRYACPSLEDLELQDCWCKIEAINSDSLKSLVLRNCRWHILFQIISSTLKSLAISGGSNSSHEFTLYIWTPAIAHLHLDVPPSFTKRVVVN